MAVKKRAAKSPLPTKKAILDFLQSADEKVGKREIARAFSVTGDDRIALKQLLREMEEDGLLDRAPRKGLAKAGALPPVTVIEIIDRDTDGELIGRPTEWKHKEPPPKILLAPNEGRGGRKAKAPAVGLGDRVLARLARVDDALYEARVIKKLGQSAHKILGIYEREGRGKKADGKVTPVDRKSRYDIAVAASDNGGAEPGELVRVEMLPTRTYGPKRGRVVERLCDRNDKGAISLIAVHSYGIPTEFPEEVAKETAAIKPVGVKGRTDLRSLPLVTIDPEDARDHDDAVHAQADDDPKNPGGWIVTVAIADVAAYVRPGTALDREARKRGNSVYLPDRVIPMLPEKLSNDLCSLHDGVDRPCLAVQMVFNANGTKKRHDFVRGIMRSAASLHYMEVQDAIEGKLTKRTKPYLASVIEPLYGAYRAVAQARDKRQPLDLDLPERRVEIDDKGRIKGITVRERRDAHRLIEEFMILANVCAAETLERRKVPLLYRVHDTPDREKLRALAEFLETVGLSLSKGQVIKPMHFNKIIGAARGNETEAMISEVILRSQSQAVYAPENLGHFGLNLRRYAHFTSPIRRYADLIVHRGLIRACGLGRDGLREEDGASLEALGEEISGHERRAMAAERDATDRFVAAYMQDKVGGAFHGHISGVTRFGLFVKLDETGADGLIPIRSLGNERFTHDEEGHALIGDHTGDMYRLGDPVEVEVVEAAPMTGGLRFELLSDPLHTASKAAKRRAASPSGRATKGRRDGKGKRGKGRR